MTTDTVKPATKPTTGKSSRRIGLQVAKTLGLALGIPFWAAWSTVIIGVIMTFVVAALWWMDRETRGPVDWEFSIRWGLITAGILSAVIFILGIVIVATGGKKRPPM